MANLNDTIEKFLREGYSQDDFISAINNAKRKLKTEQEKNTKIAEARSKFREAYTEYLDALMMDAPLTKEEKKVFEESLDEAIAEIEGYTKHATSASKPKYSVSVEKNGKRDEDSEKILRDYFERLFK